jgi:hypothetical protein
VIATRFDSAFSNRYRRDRRNEPREPRTPDRDAALRPERYADPTSDWRSGSRQSADELYGDGVWGRGGLDRKPTEPRSLDGRILDVPEFKPED